MNLLGRIERLEKLRMDAAVDSFTITHADFLTLTLAEIALRRPEVDNIDGVGVSTSASEYAARISGIRHHLRRVSASRNTSIVSPLTWAEHVVEVATAIRPRILRMKEAFESGDWTACRRQQAKARKTLLTRAEAIVERVEAEIVQMSQPAG